jgi:hypothetical protein
MAPLTAPAAASAAHSDADRSDRMGTGFCAAAAAARQTSIDRTRPHQRLRRSGFGVESRHSYVRGQLCVRRPQPRAPERTQRATCCHYTRSRCTHPHGFVCGPQGGHGPFCEPMPRLRATGPRSAGASPASASADFPHLP